MVSHDAVRVPVGILGNVITVALLLSPVPTFLRISKKGSVERFSPAPYLITYLNSMLWLVYALPVVRPNSTLVIIMSTIGCAIELVYLTLFVLYSNGRRQMFKLIFLVLLETLLVGLVAWLVLNLVPKIESRTRIVGIIADFSSAFMYASPLSVMKLVMTTKSVEYMPLPLSMASFLNAIVWTVYGFHPFDPYFVAPCGLGVLLGLAQLILYGAYIGPTRKGRREKREMAADVAELGSTGKSPRRLENP